MFEIKGLAQVKINKYGTDVLKIIREHIANDLDLDEKIDAKDDLDKEAEIRNKLKQFRTEISKKDNIKPYVVFNNEQMEEIIKSKPKTLEQLLGIKGFGEIKVEKYGEGIFNIFK